MEDKRNDQGDTFKQWLAKVDRILVGRIGFDHQDLEDFMSYDAWDEGMTPKEGAEECLMNDTTYAEAFADGEI